MSEPAGWFFADDPQVVAMPGSGFSPGSTPPNDAINEDVKTFVTAYYMKEIQN